VVLHGHGDLPAALTDALLHSPRGALDDVAVAAPIGPTTTAEGTPAWFPSAPGDVGPTLTAALDALDTLVGETQSSAGLEGTPVVYLGYSQGGATALAAAFRAGATLRPQTVVGLASWLPSEPDVDWAFAEATAVRAVLVHGSDDEVVPVQMGRGAAKALERHGVTTRLHELDAAHDMATLVSTGDEVARQALRAE
jgi:phospholipase/carboxylesterase